MKRELFFEVATKLSTIIETFEMLQRDSVLWNSRENYMERLLPIKNFENQIKLISNNLDQSLHLPDTDTFQLGHASATNAKVSKYFILFNIKIPLITTRKLQMYTIYP